MINLIKMNLYQMTHTKAMKVILVLAIIIPCFLQYVTDHEIKNETNKLSDTAKEKLTMAGLSDDEISNINAMDIDEEFIDIIENADVDSVEFQTLVSSLTSDEPDIVLGIQSAELDDDASALDYAIHDIATLLTLLFLTIATSIYVNADEKNGFIKNIAGQCKHKSYIHIAKLIAIFVYSTVLTILFTIAETITVKIIKGKDIELIGDNIGNKIGSIALGLLLMFAFLSLIAMFVTVFRNGTIAMIIGILTCTGFSNLLVNAFEKLLDADIEKYLTSSNLLDITSFGNNGTTARMFLVGAIALIVYNVIAIFVTEKRDTV